MWNQLYNAKCPPANATKENVDHVYRFVLGMNITARDFEPQIIKYPKKKYPHNKKCEFSATSVWDDYNKAINMKKKIPGFKNKLIAKGCITQTDGEILRDKNHHINWWVTINNPHSNFRIFP